MNGLERDDKPKPRELQSDNKRSNGRFSTPIFPAKHLTFHPLVAYDMDSLGEEGVERDGEDTRNFRSTSYDTTPTAGDWIGEGLYYSRQ